MDFPQAWLQETQVIQELEPLGDIAHLDEADFGLFARVARELISRSFILRGVDERLYDFAVRNFGILEPWFSCMGASLRKDEGLGVVAWRGGSETRVHLGREETCALLVLRLLYEEKRTEISLADFPGISVFDFVQRYRATTESELRKTRLVEIFRRFASLKLIKPPREETDPDGQILLYPSLALVLDHDGIREILAYIHAAAEAAEAGNRDAAPAEEEA